MKRFILLLAALAAANVNAYASRHDRIAAREADSIKPMAVKGGTLVETKLPYEATFDAIRGFLQKADYTVEVADHDAGTIFTSLEITGKGKQTGSRVQIVVIKNSESSTTLKIAVQEMKRYNILQADPWSEPKLNEAKTAELATKVKTAPDMGAQ